MEKDCIIQIADGVVILHPAYLVGKKEAMTLVSYNPSERRCRTLRLTAVCRARRVYEGIVKLKWGIRCSPRRAAFSRGYWSKLSPAERDSRDSDIAPKQLQEVIFYRCQAYRGQVERIAFDVCATLCA